MMKKTILGLVSLTGVSIIFLANISISAPNASWRNTGQYLNSTSTEPVVNVTSSTVITRPAISYGIQRFFKNNGTGRTYYSHVSTSGIVSTGQYIEPGQTLIEDRWFGNVHLLSDTTTNNIRIQEDISTQN